MPSTDMDVWVVIHGGTGSETAPMTAVEHTRNGSPSTFWGVLIALLCTPRKQTYDSERSTLGPRGTTTHFFTENAHKYLKGRHLGLEVRDRVITFRLRRTRRVLHATAHVDEI